MKNGIIFAAAGRRILPDIEAGSPPGEGPEVLTYRLRQFFLPPAGGYGPASRLGRLPARDRRAYSAGCANFFCRRPADTARHRGWVASRRGIEGPTLQAAPIFSAAGQRIRPGIEVGSPPGEGQGVRGASPSTPPTTPYSPCPEGEGHLYRMMYPTLPLAAGGNRCASSRALRGRYAHLLRRSRLAGIASAPRLAGTVEFLPVCTPTGVRQFPWRQRRQLP